MTLRDAMRRRIDDLRGPSEEQRRRTPDPAKVPTNRGTWEEAALLNVDVTELVKRELGARTPPWKK